MNQTLISVPSLASRRALLMLQAASLFNQLLQHFPRTEFASLVKKHHAEGCLTVLGVVARDHVVGFGGMEISADGWFQAGEGRDGLCGEVPAESGAGSGK